MTTPAIAPHLVEDDPKRPYKAYVSGALTAVATFVLLWLQDKGGPHGFTSTEFGQDVVAAILASGLIGGGTFLTKNPKRLKR